MTTGRVVVNKVATRRQLGSDIIQLIGRYKRHIVSEIANVSTSFTANHEATEQVSPAGAADTKKEL